MKHALGIMLLAAILAAGCITQETSIEELQTQPIQGSFPYSLPGSSGEVQMTLYKGLNDYLAELPRTDACDPLCPTEEKAYGKYLSNELQDKELRQLVYLIKAKSSDEATQVRAAISLVQRIPYDSESYERRDNRDRYPYQVLYDNKGVCDEKTRLLGYLLKNMGYGTAILSFREEEHSVLGLSCPEKYSYGGTGYCFIEVSAPAIPTYSDGTYPGFGKIKSLPKIIKLSEGRTYEFLSEEYADAQELSRLSKLMEKNSGVLEKEDYESWQALVAKYGI